MSDLEVKTNRQSELGNAIEKLLTNFSKDSKDRKTEEYLTSRLKNLEQLWGEFEKNDDKIRTLCIDPASHAYFVKEYYAQVEQVYLKLKTKIEVLLKEKGTVQIQEEPISQKIQLTNTNAKIIGLGSSLQFAMNTLQGIIIKAENSSSESRTVHEHMIARIEKFLKLIEEKEREIFSLVNNEEIPFSLEEYQNIQEKAEHVLISLKMKIHQVQGSTSEAAEAGVAVAVQPSVKLNQITIPKFNGDHSKWQQFHDLFEQLVHRQAISNTVKMFYLKDNVSGEAEQVIRHLMVTDANYDIAWAILKNKYDDKRELVNNWLKRIVNQKPVHTASADTIKKIHDNVREATLALESPKIPIKSLWEGMVMYLISTKLDATSKTLYEQALMDPQELQSLESFMKFLQTRYRSLNVQGSERPKQTQTSMTISVKDGASKCAICKKDHPVYFCDQFKSMTVSERNMAVKKAKLCLNCLKTGHFANKCSSRMCIKCGKRHNTLLHSTYIERQQIQPALAAAGTSTGTDKVSTTLNVQNQKIVGNTYAILGTALIDVKDSEGNWLQCRALIDPGSQVNIATERLQKKLKMDGRSINSKLAGLGEARININNRIQVQLRPRITKTVTLIDALVMKTITSTQPQIRIATEDWDIPSNIMLADPQFNIPQQIDLLMGVELYSSLVLPTQIRIGPNLPMLQESTLGWIVMGSTLKKENQSEEFCGIGTFELDEQIKKFWELEEYIPRKRFTTEEIRCEMLFDATTKREKGRFVVKLPLQNSPNVLGESMVLAHSRLMAVEKKLKKSNEIRQQYVTFMKDMKAPVIWKT